MKKYLVLPLLLLMALQACKKNEKKPEVSLTLSETSISLFAGETHQLKATLNPPDSPVYLIWSSSNEFVASVDQKGLVTAYKTGKITVQVTTSDSLHKAKCEVTVNPSVYAALNTYKSSTPNANLLRDGKIVQANVGKEPHNAGVALSISDNDVYMLIFRWIGDYSTGSLYKNGKLMYDVYGPAYPNVAAKSMVVNGSEVYIAGDGVTPTSSRQGVVWKDNTVLYTMSIQFGYPVSANSIFVAGGDVYVAGGEKRNRDYRSIVWRNGEILYDYADVDSKDNDLFSVFVHNGVVYAGGYINRSGDINGLIYKNDKILYEFRGSTAGELNDGVKVRKVWTDGTTVYSVGVLDNQAAMWKNDVVTLLGEKGGNDTKSIAEDICMYGTDIYVAGQEKGLATIWKNGKKVYQHTLGEGMTSSNISSLVIK